MKTPERVEVRLPEAQLERVRLVRDAQMDALQRATKSFDATLSADVKRMIGRMRESGWSPRVIEREAKTFARRNATALGRAVASQVTEAARLGERYSAVLDAHLGRAGEVQMLSGTATAFQVRRGAETARASLAQEVLLSREAAKLRKRPTPGDAILRHHVQPWRDVRPISRRLHGHRVAVAREVSSQTLAAVRDAKNLAESSSDLIRAIRDAGKGELAKGGNIPAILRDLEQAGTALNRRGGEDALAEWQRQRRELRRYMGKLAEGGRAQTRALEILQQTKATSAKGIERAVENYAHDKQRYAAERILKTEQQAAFKAEQIESDRQHPAIVAYIWHMNRGGRSGYARRVKPSKTFGPKGRRKGGARRRCVCEELDGRKLSGEEVQGGDTRLIAHPHCMCWLEPVFDKRMMLKADARYFREMDDED